MEKLKVVIVDDAAFMRKALSQILGADPEIEVVDAVKNGLEALQVIKEKRPDVITLDMDMPIMDGLTAIRHLMIEAPLPIVVLSSLVQEGSVIFEALRLGVVDFIPKPSGAISLNIHGERQKIIDRVKMAHSVRLGNLRRVRLLRHPEKSETRQAASPLSSPEYLVALGTSISGSNTLIRLISRLSPLMPAAGVAVQEISPKILPSFAQTLPNQFVPWTVEEGRDGVRLNPGTFYICSNENSISVEKTGTGAACLRLKAKDPQPLDLLFSTAADVFGQRAMGVLLTGLGRDGVKGFTRIRQKGGTTIGEDTDCCVHPDLVGNALRHGVVDFVLKEREIPRVIHSVLTSPQPDAGLETPRLDRDSPDGPPASAGERHGFAAFGSGARRIGNRRMDRKERRKHERLPFLDPKSEENHLIFDLSSMGALFAGKKRVEVGQRISLEVTLPKSMGKLFLPGEIRWVKPIAIEEMHFYLAGMQFAIHDDLTSSTLKAFLQFLRRRIVIRENRSKAVSLLDEVSLPKPEKPE